MSTLSAGKIRRLQQLADGNGVFVICAMDHRGSLKKMLEEGGATNVGYRDIVDFKLDLCRALAPHASAVLLDPIYGVAQAIAAGVLPGRTGCLVSMEESGYTGPSQARRSDLLAGWNVDKLKRLGGQAAKLLLYYRPDLKELSQRQLELVNKLSQDCAQAEVPLLVEAVGYQINEKEKDPKYYAKLRPEIVIETARQLTALPIDVLKAEFPADSAFEKDKDRMLELCRQLDKASRVPWVLLSGGVNYEVFRQQVETACKAGASGFLGGRALWQEATGVRQRTQRYKFLETTAADRLKALVKIVDATGTPWYQRLGLKRDALALASEDWYQKY